jgi:beta-lactamase class A
MTIAALVVLLGAQSVPATAAEVPGRFVDDDGLPGELYLDRLAELGAIHGCNPPANTRSCPHGVVTRAEAVKILIGAGQAYGKLPSIPGSQTDRFVDDNTLWSGSVSRLTNFMAELGIIHGCNPPMNNRVCPSEDLSKGAVAKLVVRTFGLSAPGGYATPWTDTGGRWYAEAARVAAYHDLFDASDRRFRGGDPVTRAEFAQVVVEAGGDVYCDDDPFTAGRVSSLEAKHPGQSFAAYAYDTRSRCAYWMNPQARLRTASVFKVMVMAGTLLEAQNDGRAVTSWEWSRLLPMITQSANQPVRDLWRSFGASPWFRRQAQLFGLDQTKTVGDTETTWGRTTTSAKDQGDLIRQVLLGDWGPLDASYREEAWDLMSSVVASQTWGVTKGVPSGWTVAQKNGFAGHIANSAGFVQAPGSTDGYVVVVLSNGWSDWTRGVPAVEQIAGWVSSELAH